MPTHHFMKLSMLILQLVWYGYPFPVQHPQDLHDTHAFSRPLSAPDFHGQVLAVIAVDYVAEGRLHSAGGTFAFCAVIVVIDRDKMDSHKEENPVNIVIYRQVAPAGSGKISLCQLNTKFFMDVGAVIDPSFERPSPASAL